MLFSRRDLAEDGSVVPITIGATEPCKTVVVLNELLTHSIRLRDLYKNARWQAGDIDFHRLRQLFDSHYREQVRLVDVLIDRISVVGGASRLFASNFLQDVHFSGVHGRDRAATRWLRECIDAHELVLSIGRPNGSCADSPWLRDVAVREVLRITDLQKWLVNEQLVSLETRQLFRSKRTSMGHVDTCR